ncbi:hypothetical protein ASD19_09825 [Microbacterium sp. Root53]|uniref:hypothetical protein n=1 Tax=Microbacterium sp. Root53 TaxID=1736553 RepID=UPI0006F90ECC|nr:hypothetical protein [Microbacterium sp. Root53]KQY96837.1 hypothetical protein ASD19_09825 [Microbacterium sp. Root53]
MSEDDPSIRRVRFYSVNDLSISWYLPRVAELVERFDPESPPAITEDLLEFHNVQQFLEHGFFPAEYSEEQRKRSQARIPEIHRAIARYFSALGEADFATAVATVGYEYHADLIDLLGRYKAFDRCRASVALPALTATGVHLGTMLASRKLVEAYDAEIRSELLASPSNAEHVIRKHLEAGTRTAIHLPRSLSPSDAHSLLERYIDSEDANTNYIKLIATAKDIKEIALDAKLRLRAQRRNNEITNSFFAENSGFKTGCEVGLSDSQDSPEMLELDTTDGWTVRYTYSTEWLNGTLDEPSILNNFQHLFGFVDEQSLLVLPAYPSQLGVMERFMGTTGKNEYKIGAEFRLTDIRTLLQTRLYHHFLGTRDVDLERVFSWFFEEYLENEFGAANFAFTPSDRASTYLQRVRHLFVEMESAMAQFTLFARYGEVDRDLLSISSEPVRYKEIPSLLPGKYVYAVNGSDLDGILHLLFSDQSLLTYISESLKSENAAGLMVENHLTYDDFAEHQRPAVDFLISRGVLANTGTRVGIASAERFHILASLFTTRAASYYHLSEKCRSEVDAMVTKGWVTCRSTLLTEAEADYFNYILNAVDFSNGPNLRNRYLHGTQANRDSEDEHFTAYVTALRVTVALIIKLNDDFWLAAENLGADPLPEKTSPA